MSHSWNSLTRAVGVAGLLGLRVAHACPEQAETARTAGAAAEATGDFATAQREFAFVTAVCAEDRAGWREAGRAAAANRDAVFAATAFERAEQLGYGAPDPELHFLYGEVLYTLDRAATARREHEQALREIGPAPAERLPRLWRAKILVRRGDFRSADLLFAQVEAAAGVQGDEEASIARAEGAIEAGASSRAREVLQRLLLQRPGSVRAQEVLAWVFEIDGDLDGELGLRERLLVARPVDPSIRRDYARALERSGDLRGALASYRRARELGARDADVDAAIDRVGHRLSPELLLSTRTLLEPAATAYRVELGGTLAISRLFRLAVFGWRDAAQRDVSADTSASVVGVSTAASVGHAGWSFRVAASYRHSTLPRAVPEGFVRLASDIIAFDASGRALVGPAVIDIRSTYHAPWTDAALSIVEGGDQTGGAIHVGYPTLGGRFVLDAAALVRDLQLSRDVTSVVPRARHKAWSAGFDVVAWVDPARRVRGEILDDRLEHAVDLQDALVLAVRHYEAYVDTEPAFLTRIQLAPRVSTEAASVMFRKSLVDDRLGIDVHVTFGYDHARDISVFGGGVAILAVPWSGGRFAVETNIATETVGVVLGRREWITGSYHHDLD